MSTHNHNQAKIGRRRFLQIIAVAGAVGGMYGLGLMPGRGRDHLVRQSRSLMGTQINLIVQGPDEDQNLRAVAATFKRMEALEAIFSRHRDDSELARLNQSGTLTAPSRDFTEVIELARTISQGTEGSFDVTVLPVLQLYTANQLPTKELLGQRLALVDYRKIQRQGEGVSLTQPGMGITLDGIAKGYVVDQGVAILKTLGFANVYVEAGGDLMVTGSKPAGEPWRIGVREPRPDSASAMMVIAAKATLAVATSGDYMQAYTSDLQNHHILDPKTGMSPPELASATITAPTAALADGLATAAMVMGAQQSMVVLRSFPGCEGLFIDKDLRHHRTPGFQA